MPKLTRDTSSGKFVQKGEATKRPATTVQERVVRLTPKNIKKIVEACDKEGFHVRYLAEHEYIKAVIAAYRKL